MNTNLWTKPISIALLTLLSAAVLSMTGCGGERSDANKTGIKVNTPAQITNVSKDNYDDNVNGLITHKTLKGWLDNWDANKPKGINGKLVIIQQTDGETGKEFIKPNNKNVFTYTDSGWLEPRNNGLMNIGEIVLSGSSVDLLIRKYGIDVNNDMIVCAQGAKAGATGAYMNQGRCWFTFSYWGVPQNQIAVLNGNNDYLFTALGEEYFSDSSSPIISRQVSSVKDLKADNTALYASIEDVINVLPLTDAPNNGDDVMLWDARNLPQYSGGQYKWDNKSIVDTAADGKLGFQNSSTRQGHPRGALNLEFTNLLDVSTGLYHSKADLESIVKGGLSPKGEGFVTGENYQLAGVGNAYQAGDTVIHYCETSMRAGITIISTAVVLGIPSRLYDSAMIEWNSLTAGAKDKNGIEVLPANSPWDTEVLSGKSISGASGTVAPRSAAGYVAEALVKEPDSKITATEILENLSKAPLITNAFAENVNLIPEADKAYKAPAEKEKDSNSDSGGGSSALPANPCG